MQKLKRCIITGLLIAALLFGIVVAEDNFTMQINDVDYQNLNNPVFTWGDIIRFSGTNNVSDAIYISLGDPAPNIDWNEPRACKGLVWDTKGSTHHPIRGKLWEYSWDTGDSVCKYPNTDTNIQINIWESGTPVSFSIVMKAVPVPTTSPTANYSAQIAELQTQVSAQETRIRTQDTKIKQIDEKTLVSTTIQTPIPTTIPMTVTTTKTPKPTQTPDYEATIAEIQKQIDEQNDIIYQILHVLGLK
jgi:hypothetical protein